MNAAKLDKSDRLKRVLALLEKGGKYSTRDIIKKANVCAVNSVIAEIRHNGHDVKCSQEKRVFYYWLSATQKPKRRRAV